MRVTIEAETDQERETMKASMKAERFVFNDMDNVAVIGSRALFAPNPATEELKPIGLQPVRWMWLGGQEGPLLLVGFLEATKLVCKQIMDKAAKVPQQPLIARAMQMPNNRMPGM